MERPVDVDIWDGAELKRDDTLTDEQKQAKLDEALKMIKASAKEVKNLQRA